MEENGNTFFDILKGVGLALAISFLGAVVLASILQTTNLPDKAIYPINQTIKIISAFLGALFFVHGERGWLKGIAVGLLFTALSYLTFSALGGGFALGWLIILETLICAFSGAVGGIVAVNMHRN